MLMIARRGARTRVPRSGSWLVTPLAGQERHAAILFGRAVGSATVGVGEREGNVYAGHLVGDLHGEVVGDQVGGVLVVRADVVAQAAIGQDRALGHLVLEHR